MKGRIVKGIAGFYYVRTAQGIVYQCKARGIFKKEGIVPTVGDEADIEVLEDGDAVINTIFPRKNIFIRPPISNVDCLVLVFAAAQPEPSRSTIDRFLVMTEKNHINAVLCINKLDLLTEERRKKLTDIYSPLYPLVFVSGKTGEGTDELRKLIEGRSAAFAGPSGVGKSTLLNLLIEDATAQTGEISRKTLRGRNTTRHVEIFPLEGGGDLFDTPGFTSFDVLEADEAELQHLYPEMIPYIGKCRYDNCRHLREPGCAVREAVRSGAITKSRYTSYCAQLEEIIEKNKNKY
ncbi:MAG: ribosome small subunit-dependent GTPase A [Clostridia bacterium]|nr:ribosome small subunit-dependent GTPase A [Clostridia bacterium]